MAIQSNGSVELGARAVAAADCSWSRRLPVKPARQESVYRLNLPMAGLKFKVEKATFNFEQQRSSD